MTLFHFITGLGKPVNLKALWKQGWHEIPAVMLSCVAGVTGLCLSAYGVKKYIDEDNYHRRYRGRYVVYRPDNPNVPHIKHDLGPYIKPN